MLLYTVDYYQDPSGRKPFRDWLYCLRDRVAIARITARLGRLELGNFGDCKFVGNGVRELRISYGPGYRVYYGIHQQSIVLLLLGGDKRGQKRDIDLAVQYWREHQERNK